MEFCPAQFTRLEETRLGRSNCEPIGIVIRLIQNKKLMTKLELLELLAPLSDDAEIMIDVDGELMPVCNGDSHLAELVNEEDPDDSMLTAVLFPCFCALDGEDLEDDINPQLN